MPPEHLVDGMKRFFKERMSHRMSFYFSVISRARKQCAQVLNVKIFSGTVKCYFSCIFLVLNKRLELFQYSSNIHRVRNFVCQITDRSIVPLN